MACPECKNPIAVCGDVQGPSCHVSVPMTPDYWDEVFVPCCNRRVIGAYFEHVQTVASRENKIMGNPTFITRELLQYEVMIDHGDKRTRIHGRGWQRLLDEYAVRPGDTIYICLPRGDHRFFVDVERDGIRQTPLPFIALNGLSVRKLDLVNNCVYTRGISLEFPEMRKMIQCAFGPLKDPCCIFVHKLNSCDIGGGYMRIPKKVVERIEERTGEMDDSGRILLVDDVGTQIDAAFKKSTDGRLVIQGDFRKYAEQLNLKVDDVVITFHKHTGSPSTKVRFSVIA